MCLKLEHKIEFKLFSWEKVWKKRKAEKKSSHGFVVFLLSDMITKAT